MPQRKSVACRRARHVRSAGIIAVALFLILSSSALLAQIVEQTEDAPTENAEETVVSDEAEDAQGTRSGERPNTRLSPEERERIKQENKEIERLGEMIDQLGEAAEEEGENVSFEELKKRAEAQLFQAAEQTLSPDGTQQGEQSEQLVCFRQDGSVTSTRDECDPDQGRHFGVIEDHGVEGTDSVSAIEEQMGDRFGAVVFVSDDLVAVVGEALDRLSAMLTHLQGNSAAMGKIQEAMIFLSGILRQQSSGQSLPEDTRDQIRMRLEEIMQTVGSSSGTGDEGMSGDYSHPDMNRILVMMENMIPKLPQVIAIFEEEGIPVAEDARAAADEVVESFNRLKEPCRSGDMNSCMELAQMMGTLDQRMRPPMEKAMMESGRFDVGERIHALMSDGMEDMDMMGPPPGMDPNSIDGPPEGFHPSDYSDGYSH